MTALVLYPYQQTGVEWLMSRTDALLADDPGIGKTVQTVVAGVRLKLERVLVICPASVKAVWHDEIRRWGGRPLLKLWRVMSYEGFRINPPTGDFDLLVVDEAHYLKSPTAARTKKVFGENADGSGFTKRCKRVWLLTGTPTPNNASELWPMFRALFPGLIEGPNGKPRNFHQFTHRYCKMQQTGFGEKIVGARNVPELKEKLGQVMLRRRKADVLPDLPALRIALLPLEATAPTGGERFAEQVREVLARDGLDGLKRLGEALATYRRAVGIVKAAAAAAWARDQLDGGLNKIVLFAYHREVIALLEAALAAYGPITLDGSTLPAAREVQVERFQREPTHRVFIGQIQAAGTGITLTAASDVVLVESSWVPAENDQAIMRIHRIGQSNACLARLATIPGSIDEDIQRACARKLDDINALFNN